VNSFTYFGLSDLAWFGIILSVLILVVGMILSRSDINTLKHGGLRNRVYSDYNLTLRASANLSFVEAMTYLLEEFLRCRTAGAATAATSIMYISMDAMAFLAMPAGQERLSEENFADWVDLYLGAEGNQGVKFNGKDVYAARCRVLHGFEMGIECSTSEVDDLGAAGNAMGGFRRSATDQTDIERGAVPARDFAEAIDRFVGAWEADADLRARGTQRLAQLFDFLQFTNGR
jgi:hypothetical protein